MKNISIVAFWIVVIYSIEALISTFITPIFGYLPTFCLKLIPALAGASAIYLIYDTYFVKKGKKK